jgi:POT family proton-dependent oligopeptide transporter
MSSSSIALESGQTIVDATTEKHPPGLYVLFATEMWERFSFYSMLALFTLYMQNGEEGFGWTAAQATNLYSWYLAFVYASPLIGGLIADKITGYRKAVMIGGFFFMAGHLLLSFRSLPIVYLALVCLVVGNGFFKPNVSAMVGNLYKEGSHLKDRAYNIFYLGINVGAFFAPLVMEAVKSKVGNHPAFAVAAFGMVISVTILWRLKKYVEHADTPKAKAALGDDISRPKLPIDEVSDSRRIGALIVIFLIVIVFWMVFHQNSSTLTYWADDNTAWNVSGTISNAINPGWILVLTFPLVWFWKWLDSKGKEPSTPVKMMIGMCLTALSFLILYFAATVGEGQQAKPEMYATGSFRVNDRVADYLKNDGVPEDVVKKLTDAKIVAPKEAVQPGFLNRIKGIFSAKAEDRYIIYDRKFADIKGEKNLKEALAYTLTAEQVSKHEKKILERAKVSDNTYLVNENVISSLRADGVPEDVLQELKTEKDSQGNFMVMNKNFVSLTGEQKFLEEVGKVIPAAQVAQYKDKLLQKSYIFEVSWFWLILAYGVLTLGELMLSPMGLALVSKVAPQQWRGLMMGGWFLATAIGNKLTMIGVYWGVWKQSSFFIILGGMAFVMAIVLFFLLRPLKKAMPGV